MSRRDDRLVSPQKLADWIAGEAGPPVIVDCRFDLLHPAAGRETWQSGHIPGAYYADLDNDLASPRTPASGRHPLPDPQQFSERLGSWGLRPEQWLVAYDQVGGAIAARLWWLLRWAGHSKVVLLDGGIQAWEAAGYPLTTDQPATQPEQYALQPGQMPVISVDEVQDGLQSASLTLLDARDTMRFRGGSEPIDAVAGHVPGALNRPFSLNLDHRGCFKDEGVLAAEYADMLEGQPTDIVSMCGSGVTACHNLFAMELAGLPVAKLFVDSWSGWITDYGRPIGRA